MGLAHPRTVLRTAIGSLLALALLAGCATAPRTTNEDPGWASSDTDTSRTPLPEALHNALEGDGPDTVFLKESPWGSDIRVILHPPYAAASGRTCRRLTLEDGQGRRPGLACESGDDSWESVRVLTHEGHAVRAPASDTELLQDDVP